MAALTDFGATNFISDGADAPLTDRDHAPAEPAGGRDGGDRLDSRLQALADRYVQTRREELRQELSPEALAQSIPLDI